MFGVFGDVFGDVRVKFKSGQRFSKFKMASIGVDGALGVAELLLGIISVILYATIFCFSNSF